MKEKIAMTQLRTVDSRKENLAKAVKMMKQAAGQGSKLIRQVFPTEKS